jgi:ACT domain-containing protein
MSDRNPHNPTLSAKQIKAIPVILSCRNISEGVKKARISRDTFYEWMKETAFRDEYNRRQKELVNIALQELKGLTKEAVDALRDLVKSRKENIRLKTAMGIIEKVLKSIEIEDIRNRLDEIEARIKE